MPDKTKCTAVFDIGKTNKKLFLFDDKFQEVYKKYKSFKEIKDEDGFPADNLKAIRRWLRKSLQDILDANTYDIHSINFSTYGATMVHLDKDGNPLTPLYNYLKPFPEKLLRQFHKAYGDEIKIATETGSPAAGMLNAGWQLYRIKYEQPQIFKKIKWSLHFPQYISYLFTGIPVSEYTSIGCHTSLWDYQKKDYHEWVYKEGLDEKLPPIVHADTSILMNYGKKRIKIGVGIHDSSAALLPYLRADSKPFLLLSTGTWSIALNPFVRKLLTKNEIKKECLNYMRIDGRPVKAARLFLGAEYKLQVKRITKHFNRKNKASLDHKKVIFDAELFDKIKSKKQFRFNFKYLNNKDFKTDLSTFNSFEAAMHQLLFELMQYQVDACKRAMGSSKIRKIYIDGGFADNDLFVKMLAYYFKDFKLRTTQSPLGSALGAALVISEEEIGKKFLKKHYAMNKVAPIPVQN